MKQLFTFFLCLSGTGLWGTTYYVSTFGNNGNPGTISAPFLTIQHGVNQLVAGDSLIVQPGTYNEKVLVANKMGTTANKITIVSNGSVTLSGTSLNPISREGLITIRNSSFIVLRGFEIEKFSTSGGGPTPVGILVDGAGSDIQIRENTVREISNTTTCSACAEGAHGIGVFGTTTTGIKNIDLISNEVYNNLLQSSEAFVINGNVDGFRVINNYVHDNNNIAFDFIGFEGECGTCGNDDRARNGMVTDNRAENNSSIGNPWYPGTDGTAGGFYVDGGQYILFDRNISTGNDIGFEFASEMPGKKTEDILMTNNYIYNNIEVGVILGGYNADNTMPGGGSAEQVHIINNSFYQNKGWGSEIVFQHRVNDSNIANNIFYGEASVGANFEVFGTNNTGNTWGRNLWWGSSTTGQGSLPGLVSLTDPDFSDAPNGDLSLLSVSGALDLGTVQDSISGWPMSFWGNAIYPHAELDHGGNMRIETIIDLGADEFNSFSNASIAIDDASIGIDYNPFSSAIILEGIFANFTILVLDETEAVVADYSGFSSPFFINLNQFGDGTKFLLIQHNSNGVLGYQNIIKE